MRVPPLPQSCEEVMLLLEQSRQLAHVSPETALRLANQSAKATETLSVPVRLRFDALYQQMEMLFSTGRMHDGCAALFQALVIAETENWQFLRGELLYHLGMAQYTLGEYSSAIEFWADCLDLDNPFAPTTRINAHIGIGQLYFAYDYFADALRHHEKAQQWLEGSSGITPELRVRLLINLIADHYRLRNFETAETLLAEADQLTRAIDHSEYMGEVYSYRAQIALANGQYMQADALVREGKQYVRYWAWGEISWETLNGRIAEAQGKPEAAATHYFHALQIADSMHCSHKVASIHQLLAGVYTELDRHGEAEMHHRRYFEHSKLMMAEELLIRLKSMEADLLPCSII